MRHSDSLLPARCYGLRGGKLFLESSRDARKSSKPTLLRDACGPAGCLLRENVPSRRRVARAALLHAAVRHGGCLSKEVRDEMAILPILIHRVDSTTTTRGRTVTHDTDTPREELGRLMRFRGSVGPKRQNRSIPYEAKRKVDKGPSVELATLYYWYSSRSTIIVVHVP